MSRRDRLTFRLHVPTLFGCALAAVTFVGAPPAEAGMPAPKIKVLSNRADLVSGGEALVRVTLPRGARASRLRLTAGRRNVTGVLKRVDRRRLIGAGCAACGSGASR